MIVQKINIWEASFEYIECEKVSHMAIHNKEKLL